MGSLTAAYLKGELSIATPKQRRPATRGAIVIKNARENNLKDIDVEIPLGVLITVTGVSGSGKSTLVNDILYRSLARELYRAADEPGAHTSIEGIDTSGLADGLFAVKTSSVSRRTSQIKMSRLASMVSIATRVSSGDNRGYT